MQQQPSNNPNPTGSTSPNKLTLKERVDMWTSILGLVAIILVQVVFAWYIHNQDQNLQNQLTKQNQDFQLQLAKQNQDFQLKFEEIQREANQARLQFSNVTESSVDIKNIGQVTANNVVITTTIIYIFKNWNNLLPDINKFNIDTSDNSAVDSKIPIKIQLFPGAQQIPGNNAEKITLKALGPGEHITINIGLDSSMKAKIQAYNFSGSKQIKFTFKPSANSSLMQESANLIRRYLDEKIDIVTFDVNTSCSNCLVDSSTPNEMLLPFNESEISLAFIASHQLSNGLWEQDIIPIGAFMIPKTPNVKLIELPLCVEIQPVFTSSQTTQSYIALHNALDNSSSTFVWPNLIFNASTKCV